MLLVPALHPSFLLRRSGSEKDMSRFFQTCIADVMKALRLTQEQPQWDESCIWARDASGRLKAIFPTLQEVHDFCVAARGFDLSVDVETTGNSPLECQLICVGMASANGTCICVPFIRQYGGPYWATPYEGKAAWDLTCELLADPLTPKVLHNGSFDKLVLETFGAKLDYVSDSMQATHCTENELPLGLGFVATRHLDVAYWKDDAKGAERWIDLPDEQLRTYNCLHGSTGVVLEDGRIKPIKWLVRKKYSGRVKTCDEAGVVSFQHVVGWHRSRSANQRWLQLSRAGWPFPMTVTPDHKVALWDSGIRWVRADAVRIGDFVVLPEIAFTTAQRQALLGTILGDSSLRLSPTRRGGSEAFTASLECAHTDPLLVDFKAVFLEADMAASVRAGGFGSKRSTAFRFTLRSGVQLAEFHNKTWQAGVRRIPIEWLDDMGPRGLAWWFADDGCRQNGKQRDGSVADSIHLALCRYPEEDQQAALVWFRTKFGACSLQQGSIYFGRVAARAFADFVGPYLPPSCRYKLPRDWAAPTFSDKPTKRSRALCRQVDAVQEFKPSVSTPGDRLNHETRWCIDVENTQAFFTPVGLVHNCRDALTTLHLKPLLESEVRRLGMWDLYQQEIAICKMMTRATRRGLLLDQERRDSTTLGQDGKPIGLGPRLVLQRDDALVRLRAVAGSNFFDPQTPDHLRFLLYKQLKLPVVKETKTGLPSTDKDALVLLALVADEAHQKAAISALADWKAAQKQLSTWTGEYKNGVHTGGLPILSDGRLHPQWKMTPNTGRMASSPGAQNWTVPIKKIFKAGPRRKYVGVDLSQAELRFIGYTANDRALLRMYEQGIDVHTVNMAWYLKVRYTDGHEQANPQTVAFIRETIGQVHPGSSYETLPVVPKHREKSVRTLTKTGEFATNYRSAADTVHAQIRAKRDPDTNKVMFPDVTLAEIEALMRRKEKARPDLVTWWHRNQRETETRGYLRCPISGRMRFFRGGFKPTEISNWGIQTGIASWMNKCTLEIQATYDKETGGDCVIVQQVHDALNADGAEEYAHRAGEVMEQVLGREFALPGHPRARLPPDKAKAGNHLDEV